MRKEKDGSIIFTPYGEWQADDANSFGANYVDLIQNGFFNNQLLMGSFAESVITWLAIAEKKRVLGKNFQSTDDIRWVEKYINDNQKIETMKKQIGDDFLRLHLPYF